MTRSAAIAKSDLRLGGHASLKSLRLVWRTAAAIGVAIVAVVVLPASAASASENQPITYGPGSFSYTVPAGVTQMTVEAVGDNGSAVGGRAAATFAVSPGLHLTVNVGNGTPVGAGRGNGGGGSASGVWGGGLGIVAGGGGGRGSSCGGAGGSGVPSTYGTQPDPYTAIGTDGCPAATQKTNVCCVAEPGGTGGSRIPGGSQCGPASGMDGGYDGGYYGSIGGGGGGGYMGGGSGCRTPPAGSGSGGGGGSSHIDPSALTPPNFGVGGSGAEVTLIPGPAPKEAATTLFFTTPVVQGEAGSSATMTFQALNGDGSPFVGTVWYQVATPAQSTGLTVDGPPPPYQSMQLDASRGGAGSFTVPVGEGAQKVSAWADRAATGSPSYKDDTEVMGSASLIGSSAATAVAFETAVMAGPQGSTAVATFDAVVGQVVPFVGTIRYGIGPASNGLPDTNQSMTLAASDNGVGHLSVPISRLDQVIVAYADRNAGTIGSRDPSEVAGTAITVAAGVSFAPGAPSLVTPAPGYQFAGAELQQFTVNVVDPDADTVADHDDYRAVVRVRNQAGAIVSAFVTSGADSGENATGSPYEPLTGGSYTWTAQAVDEKGTMGVESATRSFSVAGAPTSARPSDSCDDGTHVFDGSIEANYAKLMVKTVTGQLWICFRLDRASPALHLGGLMALGSTAGTPSPTVDSNDAYCSGQTGNVNVVNTVAGPLNTPVRVDRFDNGTEAGVCLRLGDSHYRVSATRASAQSAGFYQDPA